MLFVFFVIDPIIAGKWTVAKRKDFCLAAPIITDADGSKKYAIHILISRASLACAATYQMSIVFLLYKKLKEIYNSIIHAIFDFTID